jgi:hypothetical protein
MSMGDEMHDHFLFEDRDGSAVVQDGNGENVVRHEIRHCFVVSSKYLLPSFRHVVLANDAIVSCNFLKDS